jgi:aspartate aminotransferase
MSHSLRVHTSANAVIPRGFTGGLSALPADPLLGLSALFRQDTNPNKVDLGVGVYKDEAGLAPVMDSVKQAEQLLVNTEDSKAYIAPRGDEVFIDSIEKLLLDDRHPVLADQRIASIQTPGGSCALRIAADFILRCNSNATLWLPDPTWVNHQPLLARTGLPLKEYPYYDYTGHEVNVAAMLETLAKVPAGDVVLLHGCCHNPSGADLTLEQWQAIADLAKQQGFVPFVDIAYQGFGEGLDQDAAGLRLLADQLPEVIITASCSKNFALYRERAGTFSVIAPNVKLAEICQSQALDIVRGYYFVPPTHGGNVVKIILSTPELRETWGFELDRIRERIASVRTMFDLAVTEAGLRDRFGHIAHQQGMFSFLGLSELQVEKLRQEKSVYMASNSRINLSGINADNLGYLVAALKTVI